MGATEKDALDKETTEEKIPSGQLTSGMIEKELYREAYIHSFFKVLRSTVFTLLVVAAATVLVAVLLLPVLQISGTSMSPTLQDGEIVVAVNGSSYKTGDIVAFYFNNQLLIKRVIAGPGQWVDIDEEGNVLVNGEVLDEPYLTDKARGDCTITLPYQVPAEKIFVLGDHRATSVDSRNKGIGCIENSAVVGRIVVRVWPLKTFFLIR